MNETLEEWIAKAEGDWNTAARELQVQDAPNFDAVCFHAQQCIEKLIKAALIQRGIVPPRIHDLVPLAQQLADLVPGWSPPTEDLRFLTRAAVVFRYPGDSADRDNAEESFAIASELRTFLLTRALNRP